MWRTEDFTAAQIRDLRMCMQEALTPSGPAVPEGWSVSPVDPAGIVDCLDHVEVKKGVCLGAYQYREGENGSGLVFALPGDAEFPEPRECMVPEMGTVSGVPVERPAPPAALDHYMEAFDGDGSPRSYLEASIALRELGELGSHGHGRNWAQHVVLDTNPFTEGVPPSVPLDTLRVRDASEWRWEHRPGCWRPTVIAAEGGGAEVSFIAFNPLGRFTLYQATDYYRPNDLRSRGGGRVLAFGPRSMPD